MDKVLHEIKFYVKVYIDDIAVLVEMLDTCVLYWHGCSPQRKTRKHGLPSCILLKKPTDQEKDKQITRHKLLCSMMKNKGKIITDS